MRLTDHHFERWARWVNSGCLVIAQRSILAVMIDEKGAPMRGEGGSKPLYESCLEADIEAAAMGLVANGSKTDKQSVAVLRAEFGAVLVLNAADKPTQQNKAHAMGMSLRTYQTRLARAKSFINSNVRG